MLVMLLGHHRGALRASLWQTYGLDLHRHRETAWSLADLVAWLPNGSPVWQDFGGPKAWSDELYGIMLLEHRLRVLAWMKTEDGSKGRNHPEPQPTPEYASEKRIEEARVKRRIDRYRQRTGR